MKDVDIRIEKVEADRNSHLQSEFWRQLFDELFAPDADEIAEHDSELQDNFRFSKMM